MELEIIYNRYTFGKEYYDICKEAILAMSKTHEETDYKDQDVDDVVKEQIAVIKIYKGKIEKRFKEYEEATKDYLDREKANIERIGYTPKDIKVDKDSGIMELQNLLEKYGTRFSILANKPNVVDPKEAREALESWTDEQFDQMNDDWTKTNDQIYDKVYAVGDLLNSFANCSFEDIF